MASVDTPTVDCPQHTHAPGVDLRVNVPYIYYSQYEHTTRTAFISEQLERIRGAGYIRARSRTGSPVSLVFRQGAHRTRRRGEHVCWVQTRRRLVAILVHPSRSRRPRLADRRTERATSHVRSCRRPVRQHVARWHRVLQCRTRRVVELRRGFVYNSNRLVDHFRPDAVAADHGDMSRGARCWHCCLLSMLLSGEVWSGALRSL